jgi:WhiB family redox-sensing transcriptional regulator
VTADTTGQTGHPGSSAAASVRRRATRFEDAVGAAATPGDQVAEASRALRALLPKSHPLTAAFLAGQFVELVRVAMQAVQAEAAGQRLAVPPPTSARRRGRRAAGCAAPGVRGVVALLTSPQDGDDWRQSGLCGQADPEVFHPERGGSARQAKATCHRCPVQDPCLEWALDHHEHGGIWGGLSDRERHELVKTRKARPDQDASELAS